MSEITLDATPVMARGFRFQWEPAQNAHVLLYPEGMVTLNESAAEVLRRCDGERTVKEVLEDLHRSFPGADLDDDVRELLAEARDRGWIHVD